MNVSKLSSAMLLRYGKAAVQLVVGQYPRDVPVTADVASRLYRILVVVVNLVRVYGKGVQRQSRQSLHKFDMVKFHEFD